MEGVVTVEVIAAVEGTCQILAGSCGAIEFRPVTCSHGIDRILVAEGEPHVLTSIESIGEDGILKHILAAVVERHRHGCICAPVTRTADEVVVVRDLRSLWDEGEYELAGIDEGSLTVDHHVSIGVCSELTLYRTLAEEVLSECLQVRLLKETVCADGIECLCADAHAGTCSLEAQVVDGSPLRQCTLAQ